MLKMFEWNLKPLKFFTTVFPGENQRNRNTTIIPVALVFLFVFRGSLWCLVHLRACSEEGGSIMGGWLNSSTSTYRWNDGFLLQFYDAFLPGNEMGRQKRRFFISAETKDFHLNSRTTRMNDQRSSKENSRFPQSKRIEDETKCGWIQEKVFLRPFFHRKKCLPSQINQQISSGANAAHPQVMQRGLQPLAKKKSSSWEERGWDFLRATSTKAAIGSQLA